MPSRLRRCPASELRPNVTTAGCSSRSSTSFARRPSMRAWARARCHSSASAYGTTPASTTSSPRHACRLRADPSPGTESEPAHVHHAAERTERGLGHGLGHGRVRVNRELDLFHGVFILPRYRQLMDDLGRVPPHDVGAQDLAVLLVAQDLHEPFGLTGSTRPAVGRERKPARYVVDLPLLALILGEPDAGHLRMAVGHTGHVIVPDRLGLLAGDELADSHAPPQSC